MRILLALSRGGVVEGCAVRRVAGPLLGVMMCLSILPASPVAAQNGGAPSVTVKGGQPSWPQFLGPQRNGISTETGLLKSWPANGPKEVWRVPGGVGMSGLAVDQGKLVTMLQKDGKQFVVVLDAESGKSLHAVPVAPTYSNGMGNGPRATPALAGDLAYVYTGEGILAAVDIKAGTVKWSQQTLTELEGREAEYGMTSSPLVVGDVVVVIPGASKGTVAAYNRLTGKLAWRAVAGAGEDTAGYSSATLLTLAGKSQVVAFEGKAAIGIDPATGELLWRHPYNTNYDCNIALPLAHDGRLFLSAGENHGSELLSLEPTGKTFKLSSVWKSFGPTSVMRNEWQTSILLDGHLYGMDNVGGAGPVTHLNCVDMKTGERKWQKQRFGKGNLIAADGKLFISTMKGELVVVRATPTQFEEIGRAEVIGTTRQAPSLVKGKLYLRDDREIVCLDVRATP